MEQKNKVKLLKVLAFPASAAFMMGVGVTAIHADEIDSTDIPTDTTVESLPASDITVVETSTDPVVIEDNTTEEVEQPETEPVEEDKTTPTEETVVEEKAEETTVQKAPAKVSANTPQVASETDQVIETINITTNSKPYTSYVVNSRASVDSEYSALATLGRIENKTFKASSTFSTTNLFNRNYAKSATVYVGTFVLKPNDGYVFSEDSIITVNKNKASFVINSDGTVSVSFEFPKTAEAISETNIIINKPVAGQDLSKTAVAEFTDASGQKHTMNATSVTYYIDKTQAKTDKAAGNTKYTVVFKFNYKTDGDFVFTYQNCDVITKARVNNSDDFASITTNSKGEATITYTFEATEKLVSEEDCVAINSTTGTMYETLDAAIANASEGDTITLKKDTTESVTITKGITLNLDGHTIKAPENASIIKIDAKGSVVNVMNGTLTGASDSAIYASNAKEVHIQKVNFINNSTANSGGAIFAGAQSGKLVLEGSTFENNTATREGGAIDTSVDTEISNCTFTNNSASLDNPGSGGGAIYYASTNSHGSSTTLVLNNNEFKNNKACAGGAIASGSSSYTYVENDVESETGYTSTIILNGGTISENIGKTAGGAIYLVGNGTRFIMNDGIISKNNTSGDGGAIYSSNWGGITINGGSITGNTALGNGGAIYLENENASKKYNINTVITLNATVTDNKATNGGGVYIKDGVQGNISGNIYNNIASTAGADIFANAPDNLTIGEASSGKLTVDCNGDQINGWYEDSKENRWNAHSKNHESDSITKVAPGTFTEAVALKAAHSNGKVIIHYVDDKGNTISEDDILIDADGNNYQTSSKTIEKYTFVKLLEGSETGTYSDSEDAEVTYQYTLTKGKVIIHYVDQDGNKLTDDVTIEDVLDTKYTSEKKSFDGYTFVSVDGDASGIITEGTTEVTYTYKKVETPKPEEPKKDDTKKDEQQKSEVQPTSTTTVAQSSESNGVPTSVDTNVSYLSSLAGISLAGALLLRKKKD